MAPPTAPPTPPTQQGQQQQTQQPTAYAVPQGSVQQSRAPPQYARPQQPQVRRTQQQQSYIYPTQPIPQYNFVIPTGHIRAQTMPISAQHFQPQVYQMPQYYFNPSAPTYSQMTGPPANGQRQTATPTAGPTTTMGPQTNEYPYNVYEMPQVIQQPAAPPQQQKTGTKKAGPNAIQIINPVTGKNIFEEDAPASANNEEKTQSHHHSHHQHHHHNSSGGKEDSVEKENAEPQTPVVSAMSDGPSVDITPKHQVSKKQNR